MAGSPGQERPTALAVLGAPVRWATGLIDAIIRFLETVGEISVLLLQTILWTFRRPFRLSLLIESCHFVGVGSVSIVALTGFFTGAAITMETIFGLAKLQQEHLFLTGTVLSLTRELSPVLGALMVTGRAGSSMATVIGSMRITEQIDALATLAVNPVQYLVVPRVLATTIMMPILTMLFTAVGFAGAWVVGIWIYGIDPASALENFRYWTDPFDINMGLIKATAFGLVLSLIACYNGYTTSGGAKGVGMATTRSVVWASVAILILDYFVTDLMTVKMA